MQAKFRLYRRTNGIFYIQDNDSGKQQSLKTTEKKEAERLCHARNEAHHQPQINREIAHAYLAASDPASATRTWENVMDALVNTKKGENRHRHTTAMKDKAFDLIRHRIVVETKPEDLLKCLQADGQKISTNYFLRRLHNFALDMQWLLRPLLSRQTWPKIKHPKKRAVTKEEYERIIARETNQERKLFYQLLWHLGGSQTDVARLQAESIDCENRIICYERKKTDDLDDQPPAVIHYSESVEQILKQLPKSGFLFPYLASVDCKDRANEFRQRCEGLGITGLTLHSFRYSWAERARKVGMPIRFAAEVLGHKSKAVHRAYARGAEVKVPALEDYEKVFAKTNVVKVKFSEMEVQAIGEATQPPKSKSVNTP